MYEIPEKLKNCNQFLGDDNKPSYVRMCKKECPKFKHKKSIEINAGTKHKERILGGIFGFCVADALGVPVEFTSRAERKNDPVQEMRAYGTYHQHFGTWSDDSSLTLCLLDSLINGYNIYEIADKFCGYYYEAYWTPHNEVFDIGNTTVQAIERIKMGVNPIECGGCKEKDNGNGSLMRILPLVFFLRTSIPFEKIKIIEAVSALTHAHKRSKLACIIYVEYAINLLNGENKKQALRNTINFLKNYCTDEYCQEFKNYNRILENTMESLSENQIKSSGYVVDTLEAVLWSFMSTDDYANSVFKAINLGGDTDTIAALTGGLSGIFYGIESVSDNWIQCLARKEDIYEVSNRFINSLTN